LGIFGPDEEVFASDEGLRSLELIASELCG